LPDAAGEVALEAAGGVAVGVALGLLAGALVDELCVVRVGDLRDGGVVDHSGEREADLSAVRRCDGRAGRDGGGLVVQSPRASYTGTVAVQVTDGYSAAALMSSNIRVTRPRPRRATTDS
jgi:hypothetical protein